MKMRADHSLPPFSLRLFIKFYVGSIKKSRVLPGFGVQGGPGTEKNDKFKVF